MTATPCLKVLIIDRNKPRLNTTQQHLESVVSVLDRSDLTLEFLAVNSESAAVTALDSDVDSATDSALQGPTGSHSELYMLYMYMYVVIHHVVYVACTEKCELDTLHYLLYIVYAAYIVYIAYDCTC